MTCFYVCPNEPYTCEVTYKDKKYTDEEIYHNIIERSGGNIAPLWKAVIRGEMDFFQVQAILPWMSIERMNRQFNAYRERTGF